MVNLKRVSQRYIIFSAICFVLISANMLIENVEAWLIIDIILLVLFTNRITENYNVGKRLNKTIRKNKYQIDKIREARRTSKTITAIWRQNILYQKISYCFSVIFIVCLVLVSINMVLGNIQAWLVIDMILLAVFSVSIIIRCIIVKNS